LLCGSAGMAGVLAEWYARQAPPQADTEPIPRDLPALLVIGSGSAMARRPIGHLRRFHETLALHPGDAVPSQPAGDILVHLPEPPPGAALDGAAARALAERLAEAALPLLGEGRLLVLSGGDTAISLLERMGVTQLPVRRELLPGIPLTLGVDASGRTH